MGLSSSQARLLSLTGRMHDIEYKAQHLEAQKLQMANESAHVYKEYENALNATKIQVKQMSADGSSTYIDATYNSMRLLGYTMKFEDDYKPIISTATEANFKAAAGNRSYFIAMEAGRVTATNRNVGGVTEIYSADQLKNMSSTGKYRLMADIDMTGTTWTSKNFSGTLDGNGYTIKGLDKALFSTMSGTVSNLNINGDVTSQGILANTIKNGKVEDVSISGSINTTSDNVGALAGTIQGTATVNNCSSSASVSSTGLNVGGLIGQVDDKGVLTATNCNATGNVTGLGNVGGLIGAADYGSTCNISNSSASGDVYGTLNLADNATCVAGGFIGGIVGSGTISNCEARGNVSAEGHVIGGFVGNAGSTSVTIKNSNSYGNVTANVNGAMLKEGDRDYVWAAGFVSAVNGGTIENCNAFGTVSSGKAGQNGNSFANVNMSETNNIGKILNGYTPKTSASCEFNNNTYVKRMEKVTKATTPNNNVITVTPPTVRTTETVNDTTGAGKTFDDINKYGGYILEGSNNDPVGTHGDDSTWFTNMVNGGFLSLFKTDSKGKDYQVNVATDTSLQEVSDSLDLKKAEAKYEADMRKIDAKDKKFDTDLAAMEQERNAIKTEMETLKTVAKDNVDRTFRLFS